MAYHFWLKFADDLDDGFCQFTRKFDVDNCTACPTVDTTRDNIKMATCEEHASNGSSLCVCGDFPDSIFAKPMVVYYAQKTENVSECTSTWAEAPYLQYQVVFKLLGFGLRLYAIAQLIYIIWLSKLCSCERNKCTKISISALCLFIYLLLNGIRDSLEIISITSATGYDYYSNVATLYKIFFSLVSILRDLYALLVILSIIDTAFSGDKMARGRCFASTFLWTILLMKISSEFVRFWALVFQFNYDATSFLYVEMGMGIFSTLTYSVLALVAHLKMCKIVSQHSTSAVKPALVVKIEGLSAAMWYYLYPSTLIYKLMAATFIVACPMRKSSPKNAVVFEEITFLLGYISIILTVCFLEGKRVPTFPLCCCRHQKSSAGLQMTAALGKALRLLAKHGLDKARKKDFPVNVAMESLLSSTTLAVAAAEDMGLKSNIEYLLDRCVDADGVIASSFAECPVGKMLRGGLTQHRVTADALSKLRKTTEKCIQWALDPDREPIGDTTPDEAAAIMLYTQNTCLYSILNNALRDHSGPDGVQAFLPYLKLLLTGLNKLPLVRAKVYRGIKTNVHDVYNQLENKVFTWWAFSSTTTQKYKAEIFLHGSESTLFTIDAIGVDITAFSRFPDEEEILLLPGTRLTVESGVVADAGHWTYELSVWRAGQQRRHHDNHHADNHEDDDDDDRFLKTDDSEEQSAGVIVTSENHDSVSRFQNIDLPHPGWETILSGAPQ